MRIDPETGAQQFTKKDLKAAGVEVPELSLKGSPVYGVTLDDINLFLRDHARKMKRKKMVSIGPFSTNMF